MAAAGAVAARRAQPAAPRRLLPRWPRRMSAHGQPGSFGERREIEHRIEQRSWLAQAAEPAMEDGIDFAVAIELDERPIDRKAEIRVVAAHDQRVRLEGEIAVENAELFGI